MLESLSFKNWNNLTAEDTEGGTPGFRTLQTSIPFLYYISSIGNYIEVETVSACLWGWNS